MEDIVAIKAVDKDGKAVAFMTWGRLFDRIDDTELLQSVRATRFVGHPMKRFALCDSLGQVAKHRYFYEALAYFASEKIPFGQRYRSWQARKRRALEAGREIWFLGRKIRRS
ncbi:MAG: hypothetical protein JO293_05875 [Candidatus Eremiobacteraeota bacterium]|nr:hypothetical protein [Candidatus Eremiobacteraeota bacterium]MBV8222870.1 hypothetical protein [Candidatus Eremiobacteraeota bacterium]